MCFRLMTNISCRLYAYFILAAGLIVNVDHGREEALRRKIVCAIMYRVQKNKREKEK